MAHKAWQTFAGTSQDERGSGELLWHFGIAKCHPHFAMKLHSSLAMMGLLSLVLRATSVQAQSAKLPYVDNYPINRALTMKDVRELSPFGRALVRNAIYARHGRPFANPKLARFFGQRSWYRKNSNWKASDEDKFLSPIEKQNARFVASTEGSATEKRNFYLDSSTLIAPGQGVGHIKLGMTRAAVLGLLGQPQQVKQPTPQAAGHLSRFDFTARTGSVAGLFR